MMGTFVCPTCDARNERDAEPGSEAGCPACGTRMSLLTELFSPASERCQSAAAASTTLPEASPQRSQNRNPRCPMFSLDVLSGPNQGESLQFDQDAVSLGSG